MSRFLLSALLALAAVAAPNSKVLEPAFQQQVQPFLKQNCIRCHNENLPTSGVRVDHLDSGMEDRHLRLWEAVRKRISDESMPPKGQPQPATADRQRAVEWINQALDVARSRPSPKNGNVRRLTVSQYRNTLRELLHLDDELAEILPPDAISRDGFVNNKDTLQLTPLQLEAYLEIAGEALTRAMVDPKSKSSVQHFRMDLGASVNPNPFPEKLVLGANSLLLENKDFTVTEPKLVKPFAFAPQPMRTKYRFIEGYAGNDTVRGWREYDSIYHSVFACMRGNNGYPKGAAYSTVPGGLLLRPAIPNDELFDADGTYGPKANFKISLRELPDHGRFRVTVTAARYEDGLLLDQGASAASSLDAITARPGQSVAVAKPGVYQVDVIEAPRPEPPKPAAMSKVADGLKLDADSPGARMEGKTERMASAFGKALAFHDEGDGVVIPRTDAMNVGEGDFTVAAWIHPKQLKHGGLISLGGYSWVHGWFLDMPGTRGVLRLETARQDTQPNGTVSSPAGVIRAGAWQHVAAVVRRSSKEGLLYVNGYLVARGEIGPANLDNPKLNLRLGRMGATQNFDGQIAEARLFQRALDETELQALIEPGRKFAEPPPEKPQEITLKLGGREFTGTLQQPAFLALRLAAGPLAVSATNTGIRKLDRVVLTPLAATNEVARKFVAFEKRAPRLGVHLGFRRDCGSTLAPVGSVQTVRGGQLSRYVFEGAIRNYPSPDVEADNVNYLAGVREIGVRSEYTDGRDMPRLQIRSVEFEGPFYETWPPKSHTSIFVSSDPRQIVRSFATRAYRRPVTAAEEAALMAVFDKSSKEGRGFQDSIKDTLQVALTSPQFLFITEKSNTPQPEPLTDHELASKLSYFLWNGPPDRTTLQLAASGTLRGQIDAEVNRMMAHPRFSRFTREFAYQWLSLDKFQVLEPDRKKFPKLTRDVRAQLQQEPIQFVEYLMRNNLPVRNLIDSDFVVANEAVADYYGLGDKVESGFRFVPVAHGRRELGGVLTQPAILAGLSDGRESNPVKRGAWLARRIVAEPPDDPPPNVPALGEEDAGKLTLRQRIERHRSQPGCVQCHTKIDPWGIAFEEFDAGGRLKTHPVDASSKLPDNADVNGMTGLKKHLAQDRIDQVAFSVLKHLATYANGRSLTYNEVNHLKQDGLKLRASGYRMKDMVRYVVSSKLFLEK